MNATTLNAPSSRRYGLFVCVMAALAGLLFGHRRNLRRATLYRQGVRA
jgi:hypothetical protein